MRPVTRRYILKALPFIGAGVPIPALAAPAPEQPWDKARRLAKELSEALDQIDDGAWMAKISPASYGAHAVHFADINAAEEAKTGSVQRWLDNADPADAAIYHALRLAEAMNEIRPGDYNVKVDHERSIAIIMDASSEDERARSRPEALPASFSQRMKLWPRRGGAS